MVEYWFVRPNVVGSSPINPVIKSYLQGVVQLVEYTLWERMVVGSSPALLI